MIYWTLAAENWSLSCKQTHTYIALVENAGEEGAIIVQDVKNSKQGGGYNVATGEYTDMIAAGIIDPTKVTRSALQHAASISGLLLTTECMITDIPEKEAPAPAHPDMGGMGGMM